MGTFLLTLDCPFFFSLGSIKSLLGSRGLNIGSRSLDGFMIFEGKRFINYEII